MIAPSNRMPSGGRSTPRTSYSRDPAGLWADVPAFTAFAHEIEDAMEGQQLRYSQRQRLLKRAEHFGIRRFDANLIIAMVQHRLGAQPWVDPIEEPERTSPFAMFATAVAIQSLIIAAGWWLVA